MDTNLVSIIHSTTLEPKPADITCRDLRSFSTREDASGYVAGKLKVETGNYYAVREGRKHRLYTVWEDVVLGF